jgi:adenylate cyclase
MLVLALGECGRVRKKRTLFLAGKTRIHLDEVEGLGAFMELEVVLSGRETVAQGIETAHRVMQQLGVSNQDLVDRAYVDLLKAAT